MLGLLRKSAVIGFGSLLIACGIDFFLVPFHILDGGLIGLGLIAKYLWGFPAGLSSFIGSIPLFWAAWKHRHPAFFASVHGLWISAVLIDVLEPFQYSFLYYIELSPMGSALLGGLIIGTGFGLLLRSGASTGGIDLLAHLIAIKYPLNVGIIVAAFDAIVISLGGVLFREGTFLLSAMTVTMGGLMTVLLTWNKGNEKNRSRWNGPFLKDKNL